jgi:hypothetical protein
MGRLACAAATRRVAKATDPEHDTGGILEAMGVAAGLFDALVRRAHLLPAMGAADGTPAVFPGFLLLQRPIEVVFLQGFEGDDTCHGHGLRAQLRP